MSKVNLIFDLSRTLLYIANKNLPLSTLSPDLIHPPYSLYFRPHRKTLLAFLFNNPKIQVGVWSSIGEELTKVAASQFFGAYYRRLRFVAANPNAKVDNTQPCQMQRNLSSLSRSLPSITNLNTICISTIANPNKDQARNDLLLNQFGNPISKMAQDNSLLAVKNAVIALELMRSERNIEDVRMYLSANTYQAILRRINKKTSELDEYF